MITTKIDGNTVELRNLQEQVEKNKADIEYIIEQEGALNQFGLKVVGQVDTIGDMPTVQAYKASNPKWEYGDAFMVGVSTAEATVVDVDKAVLLVLTRANTKYPTDFWMNLGEFPKPGPIGPEGKQGEQGIQGVKGLDVASGSGVPTRQAVQGTTYINATTGDVYKYGNGWELIGNIRGAQGPIGPQGQTGARGPIGQTGATGPQGERGIGVNILGTLTSTSQLPDPTSVAKDSAYIIPVDGINHLYVIEGTDNLVWTDFGTAGIGEKGDKGDAGIGIDTMTDLDLTYGNTTVEYDTTDGMTINGQARFTYNGGTTKDVTMDVELPIVPGDGIVIDKKADAEQVEIKADSAHFDDKYVAKKKATVANQSYLYAYDSNGEKTFQISGGAVTGTVAYRGTGGVVKVGSPSGNDDAVNLGYANEHYVVKPATPATNSAIVIGNDGNQKLITIHGGPAVQGSIPLRSTGGVVRVGTPVGVNDATTKAYVDGLQHYTHSIYLKSDIGNSEICVTVAVKDIPNPATILDKDSSTSETSVEEIIGTAAQNEDNFVMATGNIDYAGNRVFIIGLSYANEKVTARYYDPSTFTFNTAVLSDIGTWSIKDRVA